MGASEVVRKYETLKLIQTSGEEGWCWPKDLAVSEHQLVFNLMNYATMWELEYTAGPQTKAQTSRKHLISLN